MGHGCLGSHQTSQRWNQKDLKMGWLFSNIIYNVQKSKPICRWDGLLTDQSTSLHPWFNTNENCYKVSTDKDNSLCSGRWESLLSLRIVSALLLCSYPLSSHLCRFISSKDWLGNVITANVTWWSNTPLNLGHELLGTVQGRTSKAFIFSYKFCFRIFNSKRMRLVDGQKSTGRSFGVLAM